MCGSGSNPNPAPASSAPGPAQAPIMEIISGCRQKRLRLRITELHWDTTIAVAKNQTIISAPHWAMGTQVNDGAYSQRAGAYLKQGLGGTDQARVTVEVVEAQNVNGNGRLMGRLGALTMEGQVPLSVGTHTVAVTITNVPNVLNWYYGDIGWGIEVADMGTTHQLNSTRAEVFFLLDNPTNIYLPNGVWVEALRMVCGRAGGRQMRNAQGLVARVARYCHGPHNLRYDTVGGSPRYGVGGAGGTFQLGRYLQRLAPKANCYDQAAAVQALCGAVGVGVDWCYLEPFGYINTTPLLGVGPCNNPFFDGNNSAPVIGVNHSDRTAFGNHAFCRRGGNILDACAGPHTGTETAAQYCTAAIDNNPALYVRGIRYRSRSGALLPLRAGTVGDITVDPGVTGVT